MILIIQPALLPEVKLDGFSKIFVLCNDTDNIPISTVQVMIGLGNVEFKNVPSKADDLTLAFTIGTIVGENGGTNNSVVMIKNEKLGKALSSLGIKSTLPAKPRRSTKAVGKVQDETQLKAEPAEKISKRRKKEETPAMQQISLFDDPKEEKKEDEKPVKRVKKSREADEFETILMECNIPKKFHKEIRKAVIEASEYLSYELRLRFNVEEKNAVPNIYSKTKDVFDKLKAAAEKNG